MTGGPVRVAGPDDAAALLRLKQRLGRETAFMLLEPDELYMAAILVQSRHQADNEAIA